MQPEALPSHPTLERLAADVASRIRSASLDHGGVPVIEVAAEDILPVCHSLKAAGFNRLSAVTAVDWHPRVDRFEVVYQLHNLTTHERLRLKTRIAAGVELESVYPVWRSADWYEREVFDLFGITFLNHPNLVRIMMPDNWDGHPLRKDYPVHGHKYDYTDAG